jgi:hypothetical protein
VASRIKPKTKHSLLNKEKSSEENHGNFKVSFQYLDTTQAYGCGWKDWQANGLLSKAMETLEGFCKSPLLSQIGSDKFKKYGNFPDPDKTKFDYPYHVPRDACWARIHINGPAVLAGHIHRDTFYVVFLDRTHKFSLTKRVTGK